MRSLLILVLLLLAGCMEPVASREPPAEGGSPAAPGAMAPEWSDPDEALVRPGLRGEVYGDGFGVLFTFGFLLASPDNQTMYASTVAHALHLAEGLDLPLGSDAIVQGTVVGTFVYDGWEDATGDFARDFALIELNDEGRRLAHPAVVSWEGPTGVARGDDQLPGFRVFTYGATTDAPNEGRIIDEDQGSAIARMDQTMQHGDSGSPVLAWDGGALGLAVGYVGIEDPASQVEKTTLIVSLDRALEDAAAQGFELRLATAAFEAPLLPL